MAAPLQYKVGCYSRLSREDGDKPESDSIINQQRFMEDFCTGRNDLAIVKHYSDDGYTGTNFQRPAFQEMLADIDRGVIDCVVVKDLSRFGRDYIEMVQTLSIPTTPWQQSRRLICVLRTGTWWKHSTPPVPTL